MMRTPYETIEDLSARITGEAPMEDWYRADVHHNVATFARWVADGAFDSLGTTPVPLPVAPLIAFGFHPSGNRGTYCLIEGPDDARVMGNLVSTSSSDWGTLYTKLFTSTIRSASPEIHFDCAHGFIHYHWGAGDGTALTTGRESLQTMLETWIMEKLITCRETAGTDCR